MKKIALVMCLLVFSGFCLAAPPPPPAGHGNLGPNAHMQPGFNRGHMPPSHHMAPPPPPRHSGVHFRTFFSIGAPGFWYSPCYSPCSPYYGGSLIQINI